MSSTLKYESYGMCLQLYQFIKECTERIFGDIKQIFTIVIGLDLMPPSLKSFDGLAVATMSDLWWVLILFTDVLRGDWGCI